MTEILKWPDQDYNTITVLFGIVVGLWMPRLWEFIKR